MSPYTIAKPFCHWIFPTSVERLAMVGEAVERGKVAWQQDDDSFWVLTAIPGTWIRLSNKLPIAISDVTTLQAALDAKANLLLAELTLYVRTNGNDSNDGSANDAAHAFLTPQAAYQHFLESYSAGYALNLQLGNTGTFEGLDVEAAVFVNVSGDAVTPSNTKIKFIVCTNGSYLTTANVKIEDSTEYAILQTANSTIEVRAGTIFGDCTGMQIACWYGSTIYLYEDYAIHPSSCSAHMYSYSGSTIEGGGNTVTLTGTPAYTKGFAYAGEMGQIYLPDVTYVGAAIGPRFLDEMNSSIYTGTSDINYFPGNAAGTLDGFSQYDDFIGPPVTTKATPVAADFILIENSLTGFVEKTLWKNTGHIGTFTVSTLPAAASYTGCTLLCSDVGPAPGSILISNGTRWRPVNGTALLAVLSSRVSRAGGAGVLQALSTLLPLGLIKPGDALVVPFGCSKAGVTTLGSSSYRIGTAGSTADTLISAGFNFSAAAQSGGGTHRICIESDTSANFEGAGPQGSSTAGLSGGLVAAVYPTAVTLAGGVAFSTHNLYFGISITPGATDAIALEKATILWEAI